MIDWWLINDGLMMIDSQWIYDCLIEKLLMIDGWLINLRLMIDDWLMIDDCLMIDDIWMIDWLMINNY